MQKLKRCAIVAAVAILFLAGVATAGAAGTQYPTRPITLVVPFPPGGSNDLMARIISKKLSQSLGQAVVIENRGGAAGNLGASDVARAVPNGYTILIVSSTFASNAALQKHIPYDAVKSFTPIGMLAKSPLVVTVNQQFPATTPQQMIDQIRRHPGVYNYGSGGVGSLSQVSMELLKVAGGDLKVTAVPYKGTGPALNDMMGNQIQIFIASAPILLPMVRGGKLKGIGITSLTASPVAPDLPVMATALPGYQYETWWGLLAPAGTPAPVVATLNKALNQLLVDPEIRKRFLDAGAEPTPGTPAQFAGRLAQDLQRVRELAKREHISAG